MQCVECLKDPCWWRQQGRKVDDTRALLGTGKEGMDVVRNNRVHYSLLPTHPIPVSRKWGINHVEDMASEKQWLQPKSSAKGRPGWQLCTTSESKYSSRLQEGSRREDDAELQERNSTAGKILQNQEILLRKSKWPSETVGKTKICTRKPRSKHEAR